ncbi:MAG: hypothetical protein V4735_06960 [Pseudomonadota bacterium]
MAGGSVLTYLDGYCERAGHATLLAEPLNAVTNLFFILAAVLVVRALLRLPRGLARVDLWLLAGALFLIGIGSGLWHLHPTKTTVLMDVIPITLFINIYLIAALRRLLGLSWNRVALWWLIYCAAGVVAQRVLSPELLNGTIMYIPTYLTLGLITAALWVRDRAVGRVLLVVMLVWSASLIFRTIDLDICERMAFGTHFLWHTLNAWVLWRLSMVLVEKARA